MRLVVSDVPVFEDDEVTLDSGDWVLLQPIMKMNANTATGNACSFCLLFNRTTC